MMIMMKILMKLLMMTTNIYMSIVALFLDEVIHGRVI